MLSPFYGADLVSIVRKTRKGPQQDVGSNPTGSTIFYGPQHVQNSSHSNPRPHRIKVWERRGLSCSGGYCNSESPYLQIWDRLSVWGWEPLPLWKMHPCTRL